MYKRIGVLVLSASLVLTAAGCMRNDGVKTNNYKARTMDNRGMANGGNAYSTDGHAANKEVSERISRHISRMQGVSKATVFVHDRDAVVGLDLKNGTNRANVENAVRQSVEKMEPGYRVHVTADANLHSRIRTLQSQMVPLDGHPVRNLSEDVGILLRDIGHAVTAPFR